MTKKLFSPKKKKRNNLVPYLGEQLFAFAKQCAVQKGGLLLRETQLPP